ncbi:hypothetical protein KHU50_008016 [Colletotrichum sp. SAR 10_65]|nr:hypothetical protein KHU50_008016 [Colletotrichum sp. SAR 10_65]KAI8175492.1 hypothetical protein K4K51_007420 [Colletotrichum sp. SAR 10_75]KAI8219145.1 hypothetical protein K4K53_008426 [Colletotrichum sp. SAR 10_77]
MAEAVGLAASVIAIAEITAKIGISSMKLKKLWEDLQNVPERLKDLVEEMEFWRSMMRQIEKQIRASSSSVHQQLLEDLNLRAACGRCRSALDSLAHFVETLQEDVDRSKGRWQKIKLMKKTLSSTGPLDALDKRLHRAFSTLQGLLNVYNLFSFTVDWWDDDIYRAVSDDDLEALVTVYSVKGVSLWQRNGWSLLHKLAARLGSVRICKLLFDPRAMNSVKVMAKDMRR